MSSEHAGEAGGRTGCQTAVERPVGSPSKAVGHTGLRRTCAAADTPHGPPVGKVAVVYSGCRLHDCRAQRQTLAGEAADPNDPRALLGVPRCCTLDPAHHTRLDLDLAYFG